MSQDTKRYQSEIAQMIHESMSACYEVGTIDKQTMKDFDESCLVPMKDISPEVIKNIRCGTHLSQPVFAKYMNVSRNLVSAWERGVKKPSGSSLRLLCIIQKHGIDILKDVAESGFES